MRTMNIEERIKSFAMLGEFIHNTLNEKSGKNSNELIELIENQIFHNSWFTPQNVRQALIAIAGQLTLENLNKWTSSYPELVDDPIPCRVGVIMAGNIPLVGFHDFLCVLMSGNSIIVKTSSKDQELILFLGKILCSINQDFKEKIEFTSETLANFTKVIATGSNNSSRYFESYFGKYPHIIRKNRNSIAILEGNESNKELEDLGKDIFSYFGLGCRNVSKIFVPDGYDFTVLTKNWEKYSNTITHIKYANNYDFNKAVFIVNREKFFDTGYILIKEDRNLSSPVSVLHYEYYSDYDYVYQQTDVLKEKIQCIVHRDYVPYGKAQSPELWDYSDRIDTISFLLKK
jgi:hypothetical protein